MHTYTSSLTHMRNRRVQPKVDATIAAITMKHLALVLVLHCLITSQYFGGWPFDTVDQSVIETTLNASYFTTVGEGFWVPDGLFALVEGPWLQIRTTHIDHIHTKSEALGMPAPTLLLVELVTGVPPTPLT